MRVETKRGQWLGDVAIRETGDIQAIVEMAVMNGISVTGAIAPGTELLCPAVRVRGVAEHYAARRIYPVTSIEYGAPGGIGYMAVGTTFTIY
jgi:hypothetical protein